MRDDRIALMGKPESEMTAAQIKHKRAQHAAWIAKQPSDYIQKYSKAYYATHREQSKKYMETYYAQPGKRSTRNRRTATHKRFKYKEAKLAILRALGGKCSPCGYNNCERALQFLQRNPTTKLFV